MATKIEHLRVRLGEGEKARLEQLARAQGTTVSTVMRRLIEKAVGPKVDQVA